MVKYTASLLATSVAAFLFASGVSGRGVLLPRAYCTNAKQVVAGNTCANIAEKRCTVSLTNFMSYNPNLDCSNLRVGQNFCCNEGAVPRDADCTNSKTIVEGNTCAAIADKRCAVSLASFMTYNPDLDCSNLKVGQYFCCNAGAVPLPDCTNIKTVVQGNTCTTIANTRCTISLSSFQDYNPAIDCSKLEVGAKVCCMNGKIPASTQPNPDGTCSDRQVVSGDTCTTLYEKCGITPSLITQYNPAPNFCSSLKVNQWICCSSGTLKDRRPKNNADGSCATYTVKINDSCSMIEAANGLSEGELVTYNQKKTWGWAGCANLWPNNKICLSSGTAPMPLPIDNAVCGPQKPGTVAPAAGIKISTLNPCPLNSCCNIWGQCGTTKEFCAITGDGTPGTGTCISNCGMDIVNNAIAPAEYRKIGYFEAWNLERRCLLMDATSIDESKFTHVHFAFADVTPSFQVDISKVQDQFNKFKALKTSKRIVAFGGWAASTSTTTFQIFRQGVNSANRATLATNIANFVNQHGLDGADIDWEYPAAPDLPDIPPADPIDGPNYLSFLRLLRAALPSGKSLSIAAPASYWYLKSFPIKEMSSVLDYIVYMTYDLHGQWDAGSKWSQDGCKSGMCLRSHINMTETHGALVMITKAGVPANKVIVGVTSYGRSFKMKDPSCRGAMCEFTGTAAASNALPGPCTGVKGYISNAEINEFIILNNLAKRDGLDKRATGFESYYDTATRSNIAILNGTWVAYMDNTEKAARALIYKNLNLGGTSDWAHDLESFTQIERQNSGGILANIFTNKGNGARSQTGVNWREVDCTNYWIKDAALDPEKRWFGVGCDAAWKDAVAYYKALRDNEELGGLAFAGTISNFFNGPEGMRCELSNDNNGCAAFSQCHSTNFPAGYFILNSMVALNNMLWNFYDAIARTQVNLVTSVEMIQSSFAPMPDENKALKIALDIVGLSYALFAAPMWNIAFKRLPSFANKNADELATLKDSANSAVANALTIVKDKLPTTAPNIATSLRESITFMSKMWYESTQKLHSQLFNGSDSSIDMLNNLIKDGKLMSNAYSSIDDITIQGLMEKALFAILIPVAWGLTPELGVVVIDAKVPCDTIDPFEWFDLKEEDGAKSWVCHKDKMYYLLAANGKQEHCNWDEHVWDCFPLPFSLPPGLMELDGTKWGKLTKEEIVQGALNTFEANGNKNGAEFDGAVLSSEELNLIQDLNVTAAGVIILPVCDIEEARGNWEIYEFNNHPSVHYPCN